MKRFYLVSILLLSCVVAFLQADLVDISGLGTVEGIQNGRLIEYLGIPYAEPPVGANRFKAPKPVQPWSNPLKADRRVACIQSMPSFITQDEDCLVVNVFRSVDSISSSEKLPVLIWIHGGSWRTGSGLDFFVNATRYLEEGLIFVSFNYRLDMLSYLSHKALTEEDPSNPTNFGLLDQRMAIEWVSKYISSFNGDPNRITVMGLSAGAQSIVTHMQSFQEYKPKFHKAIIMSAYPSVTTIYLNQAEEIGERVVKELGCDYKRNEQVMECLRSLPAEEIMMARTQRMQFFGTTWRETMLYINDGANFKGSPRVFTNGKYNLDIPVIIGATADEGTFFAKIAFPVQSIAEHLYISLLAGFSHRYVQQNPAIIQTLLSNYTSANRAFGSHPDPFFAAYSALVGDSYFLCPSLNLLKALSKRQAVFGYLYTHVTNDFARGLGAHHGGDAKFVFGADATTVVTYAEEERIFANNVVTYFSKFVKTGTPGGPNLPAWPIYAPSGKLMSLEPSLKVIEHYKEDTCAFWEQNFPNGVAYTGADFFNHVDESFVSKLVNKYPFVVLLFLWRKRRFAMPAVAVLSIASALFWYKVITKCCCRRNKDNNNNNNNNNKKKDDKATAATQKKKTQ